MTRVRLMGSGARHLIEQAANGGSGRFCHHGQPVTFVWVRPSVGGKGEKTAAINY